jgi:hypothetical protein
MINAIDVIDLLPFELAARLECDDFFADIPVVVAEKGNIAAELARKQAVITEKGGKRGVAVIVLQIIADDEYQSPAFGPMRLKPAFQVVENVELNNDENGTKKSCRKVARRIRDVVKPLRLVGLTTDFQTDKPCIEPVPLAKELGDSIVANQVNFLCYECDSEPISQVSMPQFFGAGGSDPQLEVTCETAGADIWYTLDDSYPVPTTINPDSTATLYAGQIPIPAAGFTVRAGAFLTGSIASQVNCAAVTIEQITNQQ